MHFYTNARTTIESHIRALSERLLKTHLAKRLANGAAWTLAASVASRSCALIASILAARILGKESFGHLGILQNTIEMFGTLAGFGMGLTATKYIAEYRQSDPQKAGRIITLTNTIAIIIGTVTAITLYALAPWLARNTLAAPYLAPLLKTSAICVLLGALTGTQFGILSGFEAFKQIARVNLISGLLLLSLRTGGTLVWGLDGALYGTILSQFLTYLVTQAEIRKIATAHNIPHRPQHSLQELPVLWKFSLPSVLGALIAPPVIWLSSAMLVNQPNGYQEMGILNAANQWFFLILFLPNLMGQATLPVLFERLKQQNHQEAQQLFHTLIKINSLVILPLLVTSFLSEHLMSLYGKEFLTGTQTLHITILTAGIMAIQMPAGYILAAADKMWTTLAINTAWGLTFLIGSTQLIHLGASGFATARLIAAITHTFVTFGYVHHVLKQRQQQSVPAASMEQI